MKSSNVCSMLFLVLMCGLLMVSCGPKKAVTSGGLNLSGTSDVSYVKGVLANAPDFEEFSAKMRLTASYGGEKLSVGGSVKMKEDEYIQLSLVAVGIVEAARIELTPKRLLIVDRIGRRYVDVPYDELGFLDESKIDFYTLQAIFRNELFLPGVKHVGSGDVLEFKVSRGADRATLTANAGKRLGCSFLTALVSGLIEESAIHAVSKKKHNYEMKCTYADFLPLGNKLFPAKMAVSLQGTEKPVTASFEFSRWETSAGNYKPVAVSDRYKRLEASDILKLLLTL